MLVEGLRKIKFVCPLSEGGLKPSSVCVAHLDLLRVSVVLVDLLSLFISRCRRNAG